MPEARPIRLMMAGRLLALAVLLACLFLPGVSQDADGCRVAVLIDRANFDRQADIDAVGEQIKHAIAAKEATIEVSVSSFGGSSTAKSLDETLHEVLWKLEPNLRNSLVIASSGHWQSSVTDTLRQTSAAGIPVYWLSVTGGGIEPRIISVDSQARARPGQTVKVTVATEASETAGHVVELYANGNKVGRNTTGRDGVTTIPFTVAASGSVRIDATLLDSNTGHLVDEMRAATAINIVATTNLLAISDTKSPIVASLMAGGWPITHVSPGNINKLAPPISSFSAVILDDIAATDMPEARWNEIVAAVNRDAVGLLVLGGPNSFGLGSYRESTLEEVLPVISEPPDNETPAAIMLLVDSSGSMGRQAGTADGLSAARDAAQFAAAALRPADRIGLISFDVEARQRLQANARDDHAAAIRSAWPVQASGGTSIAPAMDLAQAALASDTAEQKMVFLMTDGMLSADDQEELRLRSQTDDFELVAMIVSKGQNEEPVSRLELSDKATLLIVDDILRLPLLMRNELEDLRAAVAVDRTIPVAVAPMPLRSAPDVWPSLDAFVVVRARPKATVMLADENGAPLAAAWIAGAGRVVTLSGGLDAWATEWLEWSRWPDLVSGLVDYVAVRDAGAAHPTVERDETGRHSITLNESMAATPERSISAKLWPPSGAPAEVFLVPDAPGRFGAPVALDQSGEYTLVWETESGIRRHSFVNTAARIRRGDGGSAARRLLDEGLLREWSVASAGDIVPPISWRTTLIALAIVLLLLTIAKERLPLLSWLATSAKPEPGPPVE